MTSGEGEPRRDGGPRPAWAELADEPFAEPWQARAFAVAVLACERLALPWDAFRDQLKAAIAEDPERPYYESWTVALERLVGPAGA
ncbi:MAG: nitrile hydratase subunit beta [Acidimicrobiia bacterium]|nr:nitrile hydratase subunit beta [Acidimicrobiia bacterium]